MKKNLLILCCLLGTFYLAGSSPKLKTVRQTPQYLSVDASLVEDTCPGHDILKPFTCSKNNGEDFSCFDVYLVQGTPIDQERYTLLDEKLSEENTTAEPSCPFDTLTCENFLQELKYNLDFSWFIANYPSSSFTQCAETYSCTRIACLKSLPDAPSGSPRSQKLSCVFKKNQFFFLGADVSCQAK